MYEILKKFDVAFSNNMRNLQIRFKISMTGKTSIYNLIPSIQMFVVFFFLSFFRTHVFTKNSTLALQLHSVIEHFRNQSIKITLNQTKERIAQF